MTRAGHMFSALALAFVCAVATAAGWDEVGEKPAVDERHGFSIQLPPTWKKFKDGIGLKFSLHGLNLDELRVVFERRKYSAAETDSLALGRRIIEDLRARSNLLAFELVSLEQVTLDGRPAFRAEAASTRMLQEQVRYRHVLYGAAGKDGDYLLLYSAPALHYFEASRPTAEAAIATFRFK